MRRGSRLAAIALGLPACLAWAPVAARGQEPDPAPAAGPAPAEDGIATLPTAASRDVPAEGRLFERGIPVAADSFSPDGFHFVYLFSVPGGFPRRKPQRCVFLLDLGTGDNRPAPTPKGQAARIGGWDPTGRYLLIEAQKPDLLSALTGGWTTYHWILDVVTGEFVGRRPFTGSRDDQAFLWKHPGTYHGAWGDEGKPTVEPLFDGELAEEYRHREEDWAAEDRRREALAERLALVSTGGPTVTLSEVLTRLDQHWTPRGQRDPVVSEMFGNRPTLRARLDGEWFDVRPEVDFVAVLDHDLCLVTVRHGEQYLYHRTRRELLPLAEAPKGWARTLDERWERTDGFYDDSDPLPRDMQYRRTTNAALGVAHYFNYVLPDLSRAMLLYSLGPEDRVLRIVDLPESWRTEAPAAAATADVPDAPSR